MARIRHVFFIKIYLMVERIGAQELTSMQVGTAVSEYMTIINFNDSVSYSQTQLWNGCKLQVTNSSAVISYYGVCSIINVIYLSVDVFQCAISQSVVYFSQLVFESADTGYYTLQVY